MNQRSRVRFIKLKFEYDGGSILRLIWNNTTKGVMYQVTKLSWSNDGLRLKGAVNNYALDMLHFTQGQLEMFKQSKTEEQTLTN